MAIQVYVDATCDNCHRVEQVIINRLAYARVEIEVNLEKLGWFAEGDAHYCEECKDKCAA